MAPTTGRPHGPGGRFWGPLRAYKSRAPAVVTPRKVPQCSRSMEDREVGVDGDNLHQSDLNKARHSSTSLFSGSIPSSVLKLVIHLTRLTVVNTEILTELEDAAPSENVVAFPCSKLTYSQKHSDLKQINHNITSRV